jgi:hypothetical protein
MTALHSLSSECRFSQHVSLIFRTIGFWLTFGEETGAV